MPPYLALSITLLFVFAAFRADHKLKASTSAAIWVPQIWMVICASRSLTQWLNIEPPEGDYIRSTLSGGSLLDQGFLTALGAAALVILARRRHAAMRVLGANKAIVLFFLYLGISTLWSDIPLVSLRRWARLAVGLLMVVAILTEAHPVDAVKTAIRRCAYLLIPLSLLYIKYFPALGVLYTEYGEKLLAGVTLEKNTLGHLSCVSALFLVWSIISRNDETKSGEARTKLLIDTVLLVTSLSLLISSQSSTSLAALLVGTAALLLFRTKFMRNHIRYLGTVALLLMAIIFLLDLATDFLATVVGLLGRDMSFTGRAPLWGILMDLGRQRPLLGYGYGGFWIEDRANLIRNLLDLTFHIGHNGYIEIFLDGGLVAEALLLLAIFSAFGAIKKLIMSDGSYGSLCMAIFAVVIICNTTESSFARPQDYLWFVFLLIGMDAPRTESAIRPQPQRPRGIVVRRVNPGNDANRGSKINGTTKSAMNGVPSARRISFEGCRIRLKAFVATSFVPAFRSGLRRVAC